MEKTGTVKWFNSEKGYGFIAQSDGGNDVFVHISDVEASGLNTLKENQNVTFEIKKDEARGKQNAINLKLAS